MSSQQLSKEEKTAYLKKWFNDDNLEQWIQQNNNAKTDDEKKTEEIFGSIDLYKTYKDDKEEFNRLGDSLSIMNLNNMYNFIKNRIALYEKAGSPKATAVKASGGPAPLVSVKDSLVILIL